MKSTADRKTMLEPKSRKFFEKVRGGVGRGHNRQLFVKKWQHHRILILHGPDLRKNVSDIKYRWVPTPEVTRLGEFSPHWVIFALGSFSKINEEADIFMLTFSTVMYVHYFC
jgi:hypothetical protein